ncbi:MAG: hypothetical protein QNJ74_17590 [Trichodesmium sp. MO_231.B1]|nr:hypothetical protein [Trichodesmium sp. MO_231.B1]
MIFQHHLKDSAEKLEIQVIKDYETLQSVQCYPGIMNIIANAIDTLEEKIEKQTDSEN